MPLRFQDLLVPLDRDIKNRLPGTPPAMVSILGGAGRAKCTAAKMAIAPTTITGPTECAKSHKKTTEIQRQQARQ